jgi:hypothetical protein
LDLFNQLKRATSRFPGARKKDSTASLATRNISHFKDAAISLVNPWND